MPLEFVFLPISVDICDFSVPRLRTTPHLLHVLLTFLAPSGYEISLYTPVLILIGKMAARQITANVIYIRQVRVKHLELSAQLVPGGGTLFILRPVSTTGPANEKGGWSPNNV